MSMRSVLFYLTALLGLASFAAANETLPKHISNRTWVATPETPKNTKVEVTVENAPKGGIHITSRFQNGSKTTEQKFRVAVLIEHSNGKARHVILEQTVPAAQGKWPEASWRVHDLGTKGFVTRVYARAIIANSKNVFFRLKFDCDYGAQGTECDLPKSILEENKPDILKTYQAAKKHGLIGDF